jgi:NDP-sugar pyrophosphorylase family protein
MENRKYEFTNESININGRILHRIRALKDFNNVKKGDLGGFIEKEENLSHIGNAWVFDEAIVYENASVFGDAYVTENAIVSGNAKVYDNSEICEHARVSDNAKIYGNAYISCHSEIYANAEISSMDDILWISNIGCGYDSITFFKCADNNIRVVCDNFIGTLEEFDYILKETYRDIKYRKEYDLAIELCKIHINISA